MLAMLVHFHCSRSLRIAQDIAQDRSGSLRIAQDRSESLRIAQDRSGSRRIAQGRSGLLRNAQDRSGSLRVAQDQPRSLKIESHHSGSLSIVQQERLYLTPLLPRHSSSSQFFATSVFCYRKARHKKKHFHDLAVVTNVSGRRQAQPSVIKC